MRARPLLWLLLATCSSNPSQQCDDLAAATCKKLFECTSTDAERMQLSQMYRDGVATCTASVQATECNRPDEQRCDGGSTYDRTAASQCIGETGGLNCTAFHQGLSPLSCTQLCR